MDVHSPEPVALVSSLASLCGFGCFDVWPLFGAICILLVWCGSVLVVSWVVSRFDTGSGFGLVCEAVVAISKGRATPSKRPYTG